MSWRLEIAHRTLYQYAEPVHSSYNEVRMIPRAGGNQILLSASVTVNPRSSLYTYVDYFGTQVTSFDLHRAHDHLEIVSNSHVEVLNYAGPPTAVDWKTLGGAKIQDDFAEYLMPTPYTELDPDREQSLAEMIRSAPTPELGLSNALEWVDSSLSYQRGITHVQSRAMEALQLGKGVCQDFSHLTAAALRAARIPARYVSGYLYPGESHSVGEIAVGESHAWVEAWLGRWIGLDPSNRVDHIDQRYVAVAKGRDYADVPPFTGIYYGGSSATQMVTVTITRRQ